MRLEAITRSPIGVIGERIVIKKPQPVIDAGERPLQGAHQFAEHIIEPAEDSRDRRYQLEQTANGFKQDGFHPSAEPGVHEKRGAGKKDDGPGG